MAAYITVGAKTSHGGTVISGSPHTTHNGIPISRKGDKVLCKKCKKVTTILSGDASFIIDGAPIARGGDVTSCGAKLIANQQSFAESGFDVMGIEQAAALVFPKSSMSNSFVNKNSDESSSISLMWVDLNDNQFVPLNAPSYDSNSTDYGKIDPCRQIRRTKLGRF
ncbi:PAAR domain-containing protein [Psychrobacter faecalis]|uniref:PAAR domain-containing protein n=1 Tax=Psychrobacter faecalis TaxID=180588 RepID=UPI003FD0ECF0